MKVKKIYFTLMELVVSLGVFSILLLITSLIFSSAQRAWTNSSSSIITFENARIAMDLMTREIQSIYYKNGIIPFYHKGKTFYTGGNKKYNNESLNFVSETNMLPNEDCLSRLCEIKYQLYYTTSAVNSNAGWLRRSATGNRKSNGNNNTKWNFYDKCDNPFLETDTSSPVIERAAFTANNKSSDGFENLIPYVTELTFQCYSNNIETDPNGTAIPIGTDTEDKKRTFPFSVELSLSLMDKDSWQKWIDIGGEPHNLQTSGSAYDFRKKHERTFTKTVLIGNRGQY